MFSRGMQMAMLASALISGSRTGPISKWDVGESERHQRRADRYPTEDLTKRPTPTLAPDKPLTKRQKRRVRGKS